MKKNLAAATLAILAGMTATAANADQINLYVHIQYGGSDRVLTGPVNDFSDIGFNDHVSSYIVKSGTWELCEHANFRGRCITVSGSDADLTRSGFNDTISSARPVGDRRSHGRNDRNDRDWRDGRNDRDWRDGRGGDRNDGITVYVDIDYRGGSRRVDGTVRNLQSLGFNDTISSIRIDYGTWEFCEHADFQGRCRTFDRDVRNLVDHSFNDRISSIRRIR